MNTKRVDRWVISVRTMLLDVPLEKQIGIVKTELLKLPLEERGFAQQVFLLGHDVAKASLEVENKKARKWFGGALAAITALGGTGIVGAWIGTPARCDPGDDKECPGIVRSHQICDKQGRSYGPCHPLKASLGGSGPKHAARDAGP